MLAALQPEHYQQSDQAALGQQVCTKACGSQADDCACQEAQLMLVLEIQVKCLQVAALLDTMISERNGTW